MADIFLSYARKDREKAGRLAKALEGLGWSVFWDRETPVGVPWRQHIEDELGKAKCVVVAWSSSSVKSEWVLEEAEDGKKRKVLIPVSLEADVSLPFGFRSLQALDISAWDGGIAEGSFVKLFAGLFRLLGAPAKLRPPPKKAAVPSKDDLHVLKYPVKNRGKFCAGPSPASAPFVQVGSRVKKGQVLCIVKKRGLPLSIKSDVAGEIVEIYRRDGQLVENFEALFGIRVD